MRIRRRWYITAYIIAVTVFLTGFLMFMYPVCMGYIKERGLDQAVEQFQVMAQEASKEQEEAGKEAAEEPGIYEALRDEMIAYNTRIYEEGQKNLKDPFAYEQASVDLTAYGFEENVIGSLQIPRLNLTLPIYLGATTENLAKGVAQLGETSMPIGGSNTNCVIAGHRGMAALEMFRNIQNLQEGDEIYITNLWETLTYRVESTKIIVPSDIKEVLIQPDKDMVTLISCHPYRQNYQRYVVYCVRE